MSNFQQGLTNPKQGIVYMDSMTNPTVSCPSWNQLPLLRNDDYSNVNYKNIINVGYGNQENCPTGQVKYFASTVAGANTQSLEFCAAPPASGQVFPQNYPWDTMQKQWQSLTATPAGLILSNNNQPPTCRYQTSNGVVTTIGNTYSNIPKAFAP